MIRMQFEREDDPTIVRFSRLLGSGSSSYVFCYCSTAEQRHSGSEIGRLKSFSSASQEQQDTTASPRRLRPSILVLGTKKEVNSKLNVVVPNNPHLKRCIDQKQLNLKFVSCDKR